jgi:hypothetical protein
MSFVKGAPLLLRMEAIPVVEAKVVSGAAQMDIGFFLILQ